MYIYVYIHMYIYAYIVWSRYMPPLVWSMPLVAERFSVFAQSPFGVRGGHVQSHIVGSQQHQMYSRCR